MPNLDTLKKHAKQLVRWHRDGSHTVCEKIRLALPSYAALTDAQILAAPFSLTQAQEVIARDNGAESWVALKAGVAPSQDTTRWAMPRPILGASEPTLFVTDIAVTVSFFETVLGFKTGYLYGEPPFYGMVLRDGARINLRCVTEPVFTDGIRDRRALMAASISVENPKALYLEVKAAGALIYQAFRKEPWGSQGFVVTDPDGNLIHFGGMR